MSTPPRAIGVLACVAVLGLMAWRHVSAAENPATVTSRSSQERSLVAVAGEEGKTVAAARAPANAAAPDPRELKARLLVAQARHRLGTAYERAAARGDFALTPGRILKSLLDRRCEALRRHTEELAPYRAQLLPDTPEGGDPCRGLLFAYLKERFALPDDLTQERLWSLLERVDAEYDRLVVRHLPFASDDAFLAAHERFREARRELLGPSLDGRLLGLSDELFQLPHRVDRLIADSHLPVEQKLAAYQELLQRFEHEHGVRLASVVEPVELAKLELRIRETAGPVAPEQQRAVLERHAGSESTGRYLDHQQEQRDRNERLSAFNQERERLLEQLRRSGLTPEQLRQRMPDIDRQLLVKYQLQ